MMIKECSHIDLMKTYSYGTSKYLVSKKEESKCSNIIKQYKNGVTNDDILPMHNLI